MMLGIKILDFGANFMQPPNNQFVDELIRQLRYVTGVLVAPGIPQKKLTNAITKNSYVGTDPVVGLIDCTVFGSAKDHIMFTAGGIYWNHLASTPTSGSIRYTDFSQCYFKSAGLMSGIDSSRGDNISTSGSNTPKKDVINLLNSIKNLAASHGIGTVQNQNMQVNNWNSHSLNSHIQEQPQPKSKSELLALAHNMSQAKNWDAAIKAYEDAGEYRMAGLVRDQKAQWNRNHN